MRAAVGKARQKAEQLQAREAKLEDQLAVVRQFFKLAAVELHKAEQVECERIKKEHEAKVGVNAGASAAIVADLTKLLGSDADDAATIDLNFGSLFD